MKMILVSIINQEDYENISLYSTTILNYYTRVRLYLKSNTIKRNYLESIVKVLKLQRTFYVCMSKKPIRFFLSNFY